MESWRYVASVAQYEDGAELSWEIRELYPAAGDRFGYTSDAVRPFGNSHEELIQDLVHMRQDCSLDVLDLRGDEPKLIPAGQMPENQPSYDVPAPLTAGWDVPQSLSEPTDGGPRIVCICGSTKFRDEMADVNRKLTLAGAIVVAPAVFQHRGDEVSDEQKQLLDELHLRKIDLADAVFVVDPGGYVGASTKREIEYAVSVGTPVFRLSTAAC